MWEYAELFDAEAEPEDPEGQLSFWRDSVTALRIGQMGYKRRTTKAGDRLEAEIYPVFGREERERLRAAKRNTTPEKQKRLNEQRAMHQLVLLMDANFGAGDYHLTLTYAGEEPSLKRCKKDVRNFLNRVKRAREKRGLEDLKYIYTIGHDKNERIHVHLVTNGGISRNELERIWSQDKSGKTRGRTNAMILQPDDHGLQGIASYLYKQNARARASGEHQGERSWCASRNLKKPKTRRKDCNCPKARVRRIAQDFPNEAKEVLEKLYPGYRFVSCEVRYSDITEGIYIRGVLRRNNSIDNRKGVGA